MFPWVGSHAPCFGRQLWRAAQPSGVALTTGGIGHASLQYVCFTPVAQVHWPRCLAGNPLWGGVPACLFTGCFQDSV